MPEILFDKDIIKSVAKELGMPEKKIEHHFKFMKSHISDLQNTEGVHTIQLPHIGMMYRNIGACAFIIHHFSNYKVQKPSYKKAMDRQKIHIEDILEKLKNFDNFSLHNYKRRLSRSYFRLNKSNEELEKFQNNE